MKNSCPSWISTRCILQSGEDLLRIRFSELLAKIRLCIRWQWRHCVNSLVQTYTSHLKWSSICASHPLEKSKECMSKQKVPNNVDAYPSSQLDQVQQACCVFEKVSMMQWKGQGNPWHRLILFDSISISVPRLHSARGAASKPYGTPFINGGGADLGPAARPPTVGGNTASRPRSLLVLSLLETRQRWAPHLGNWQHHLLPIQMMQLFRCRPL